MHALRYVVVVWLASRAFFLAVGSIAAHTLDRADEVGLLIRPLGPLHYWARWDGHWYGAIARDGYVGYAPKTGFFPAYPVLLHPATRLGDVIALGGVVVSALALLAALWFLYRIAEDVCDEATARAAVLAIAFFPTAFYFNAVYTEATFLAFATGSVWLARVRRDAILGGILGGCASVTRNVGVFLVVPLAYEWVRRRAVPWWEAVIGAALIVWGIAAYMLYLWRAFGDPFVFARVQKAEWQRSLTSPHETIPRSLQAAWDALDLAARPWDVFDTTSINPPFELANVTNLLALVFALALLVVAALRLPRGLTGFAALAIAAPLLSPHSSYPLMSMPRFVLAAFPLFIALGVLFARRRGLRIAYVAVCLPIGAFLTALFVTSRWVA